MAKDVEHEVAYYYDFHPTAEARKAETKRAEALAEKLRSLGIDPDQI